MKETAGLVANRFGPLGQKRHPLSLKGKDTFPIDEEPAAHEEHSPLEGREAAGHRGEATASEPKNNDGLRQLPANRVRLLLT